MMATMMVVVMVVVVTLAMVVVEVVLNLKKNNKGTYINMTMSRLQQLSWRPAVQWW